jgi:hypothetical protein
VSPDTAVLQEDQFAKLVELTQAGIPFPPDVLIEASALPKKRLILDKLKQAQEQAQNVPNQAMQLEAQKAQIQVQSKEQMNQIDAQAHAQQLMRQDEYDQRKAQRQEALERQKFEQQMIALKAQQEAELVAAARKSADEAQKRVDDLNHLVKSRQLELDLKAQTGEAEQQLKAKWDDENHQRESARAKKADHGAAAMERAAAAIEQLAKAATAPRRLVKDPKTGEKRSEAVLVH